MKRLRTRTLLLQVLLIGLLVAELSVVRDAVRWQRRPRPQTIDPQSLDRETAGDIRRLWRTAFDGGGGDDWQRLAECYAVYGRIDWGGRGRPSRRLSSLWRWRRWHNVRRCGTWSDAID